MPLLQLYNKPIALEKNRANKIDPVTVNVLTQSTTYVSVIRIFENKHRLVEIYNVTPEK